jgi:hypothetical protein
MSTALQYLLSLGIASVLITQVATSVRAWLERKRERDGLLRILYGEVIHNHIVTIAHSHYSLPEDISAPATEEMSEELARQLSHSVASGIYPSTAAWEATSVKLAQYLPSAELASLATYYRKVAMLQHFLTADIVKRPLMLYILLAPLDTQQEEVERVIRSYVRDVVADKVDEEYIEALKFSKKQGRADNSHDA